MNIKKLLILNLPYLLFVYPFDKLSQAIRLAPGADLSAKIPVSYTHLTLPTKLEV